MAEHPILEQHLDLIACSAAKTIADFEVHVVSVMSERVVSGGAASSRLTSREGLRFRSFFVVVSVRKIAISIASSLSSECSPGCWRTANISAVRPGATCVSTIAPHSTSCRTICTFSWRTAWISGVTSP